MQNLRTDPATTMAKMAKYTPTQVDRKFEAYRAAADQLDDLKRSERFFEKEYTGEDKEKHLSEVKKMIGQMEELIGGLSAPKSIGILSRENSEYSEKVLALMINDLRKYFILDRMITKEGILSLVPMIIATYPQLTFEEIAVCFCNAKKGFYGEDFQRMDGSTIMKWLKQYVEEKQVRIANNQYSKEVQYKAGKDVGRSEKGESLEVFLNKATGAALIIKASENKK